MKNVRYFRRSRAERETDDNYYSSGSGNETDNKQRRNENGRRGRFSSHREPQYTAARRTRERKSPEYEECSESNYTVEVEHSYRNAKPRRWGSAERNYHHGNRVKQGRDTSADLNDRTRRRRSYSTSDSSHSSTCHFRRTKIRGKPVANKGNVKPLEKNKLRKKKIADEDCLSTKENDTSKENTFLIGDCTKNESNIDSDIVFIPVIVYPKKNEKKGKIASKVTQNDETSKRKDSSVCQRPKKTDNIVQQKETAIELTSLDKGISKERKSSQTTTDNKGNSQLPSHPTAPDGKLTNFTPDLANQNDKLQQETVKNVESRNDPKLDKESHISVIPVLAAKTDNMPKIQIFIDEDTHNVYSSITPNEERSVEVHTSGNVEPTPSKPSVNSNTTESKPLTRNVKQIENKRMRIKNVNKLNNATDQPNTVDEKLDIDCEEKFKNVSTKSKFKKDDNEQNILFTLSNSTREKVCYKNGSVDYQQCCDRNLLGEPIKNITSSQNFQIYKMYDEEIKSRNTPKHRKHKDQIINHFANPTLVGDNRTKTNNIKCPTEKEPDMYSTLNLPVTSIYRTNEKFRSSLTDKNIKHKDQVINHFANPTLVGDNRTKTNNMKCPTEKESDMYSTFNLPVTRVYKTNEGYRGSSATNRDMKHKDQIINHFENPILFGDNRTKTNKKCSTQNETNMYSILNLPVTPVCRTKEGYQNCPATDKEVLPKNSSKKRNNTNLPALETEVPGKVTSPNISGDAPVQEIVEIKQENGKLNEEKSKENVENLDRPTEKSLAGKTEEEKNRVLTGLLGLGRCVIEGCHVLLGTSVHSVIMDGIDTFEVVKEKLQ